MAETCSVCGKKISMWKSNYVDDKIYCPECWKIKDTKIKEQNEKDNKEEANTKPKKWGWIVIVWVIIIILALWVVGGLFDNSEEYSSCVSNCVSDNWACVSDSISYDKSGNGWISEYDFEDCSLDLESCVSDCQR